MIAKPRVGIKPNWGHWATKGLVGCWLFNEKPNVLGKVQDLSGNGNHGTLVADTHSVPGKFGNALDFDGSDDRVALVGKPLDGGTGFTVRASVYCSDIGTDRGIFYSDLHAGNEPILLWFESGGPVINALVTASGGTTGSLSSGFTPVANTWYDVVLTWDGGNVRLYINGVGDTAGEFPDSGATGTLNASGTSYTIGGDSAGNKIWLGQIDHVMIWNRSLTASQVLSLYANPFQMFEVDL